MCKNSGFRSRIQKSYKKFGMESKNLIIFSESIPNLLPPPIASLGSHRSHRSHRLSLWVGNLTDALRSFTSLGSHGFNEKIICGNLWWFVGGKNLCNKIFVCFVEFVVLKPRHKLAQIFTNYLWAKWSVSQ